MEVGFAIFERKEKTGERAIFSGFQNCEYTIGFVFYM